MVELPGEEMCPIQRDDTVAVLGYTAGQVTAATHHCVTGMLHTLHAAGCLIGVRLTHNWCPFISVCVLFGAEPFDGLVAECFLMSGGLCRRGR